MGMYDDRQQGGGGGFSGRFIIALIIAAVGLFMYWNQTQINPVTHQKQHVKMSPDQEIKLGLQSAPEMAREMGGEVPSSDSRSQEVSKVGLYILSTSIAKDSPWKFKFHLLADDKTINAFALPGGQIFITLGLYNKLQTEAELAGVLSHEMGHVIERHSSQQMAKSQLGDFLIAAVAVGSNQDHANNAAAVAAMVNHMFQLRYSRHDESEADLWGVKLMEQAGYNPQAMVQVLEILKAGDRGHAPEMFLTHPNPDHRIQQIKEYLQKNPPKPGLKEGDSLEHSRGLSLFN